MWEPYDNIFFEPHAIADLEDTDGRKKSNSRFRNSLLVLCQNKYHKAINACPLVGASRDL